MLMEETGWDVKITDFGLAKLMDSDSWDSCGFMGPSILAVGAILLPGPRAGSHLEQAADGAKDGATRSARSVRSLRSVLGT